MGLFTKKEKLPEIPRISQLPELPEPPKRASNELPSFPTSDRNENLNRDLVKSAVSSDDSYSSGDNEVIVEELPRDFSMSLSNSAPERIPELNFEKSKHPANSAVQAVKSPIFIRVDKFQAAQKDFEDMKKKIKEIDSVISKIKEMSAKENKEIEDWTRNLEDIKLKLIQIDNSIFEKI